MHVHAAMPTEIEHVQVCVDNLNYKFKNHVHEDIINVLHMIINLPGFPPLFIFYTSN